MRQHILIKRQKYQPLQLTKFIYQFRAAHSLKDHEKFIFPDLQTIKKFISINKNVCSTQQHKNQEFMLTTLFLAHKVKLRTKSQRREVHVLFCSGRLIQSHIFSRKSSSPATIGTINFCGAQSEYFIQCSMITINEQVHKYINIMFVWQLDVWGTLGQ